MIRFLKRLADKETWELGGVESKENYFYLPGLAVETVRFIAVVLEEEYNRLEFQDINECS